MVSDEIIRIFLVFIMEKNIFGYLFIACKFSKNCVLNGIFHVW